ALDLVGVQRRKVRHAEVGGLEAKIVLQRSLAIFGRRYFVSLRGLALPASNTHWPQFRRVPHTICRCGALSQHGLKESLIWDPAKSAIDSKCWRRFPASSLRPLVRSASARQKNGRKAMSSRGASASKRTIKIASYLSGAFACTVPFAAQAGTVANPICPQETVFFSPGAKLSINVPEDYSVSMFAAGLNFPTGLAFLRKGRGFEVYVLESGHGLPSRCNEQ